MSSSRPWVKICASTSLADAQLALHHGADALGFVFAPSKRQLTPQAAASITRSLPSTAERIGVFSGHSATHIAEIASIARLTSVQLHDPFDPARSTLLLQLLPPGVSIIDTLSWPVSEAAPPPADTPASSHSPSPAAEASTQLDLIARFYASLPSHDPALPPRVLIDARIDTTTGSLSGGLGIPFDWASARQVFSRFSPHLRLILAGGLTPANLTSALDQLHPWGIDVASGVESSPGHKDPEKLALFLHTARTHQPPL